MKLTLRITFLLLLSTLLIHNQSIYSQTSNAIDSNAIESNSTQSNRVKTDITKPEILFDLPLDEDSALPADIITYELNPGRLGDHLLTYVKAKLISYLSGKPLHCIPFKWSEHLALNLYEKSFLLQKYNKTIIDSYTKNGILRQKTPTHYITQKPNTIFFSRQPTKSTDLSKVTPSLIAKLTKSKTKIKPTAYVCDLKTKIEPLTGFNDIYKYAQANPTFKNELLRMIAPIEPIKKLDIPLNMVSVAVHIRTGGTFEKTSLQQNSTPGKIYGVEKAYPRRFPPEKYYIKQLATIAEIVKKPLFVHIFTDDTNPSAIVARFKQQLSDYPITFSCCTDANDHNLNVLYDLFNMTRFNCLIRPASSFSKIAQLLGDHQIIIYPTKAKWVNNQVIVKEIAIINNYKN